MTEKWKDILADLHRIAKEKGITHEQIGKQAGFATSNVTRMLNGRYPPNLKNAVKIADVLGVTVEVRDGRTSDS